MGCSYTFFFCVYNKMPALIRNPQRRRELEIMLNNLKKIPQTNEVLNAIKRAMKLLKMLGPIRNNNNRSLHPATRKLVNTVTNYNRENAQQRAARNLANRYSKMYPLGNNNEKRLISRFFYNQITNPQRINAAQKNINKIVPSGLMTTRKGRFAKFLKLLRGPSPR
jgi:hypothetical protein